MLTITCLMNAQPTTGGALLDASVDAVRVVARTRARQQPSGRVQHRFGTHPLFPLLTFTGCVDQDIQQTSEEMATPRSSVPCPR